MQYWRWTYQHSLPTKRSIFTTSHYFPNRRNGIRGNYYHH